jgi:oligoribonuclease
MSSGENLVWVDLEMTGLDPDQCTIVEIATIVTSSELDVIAEGPCLVVHQPDSVLNGMVEEVRQLHTRSGLLDRIRESDLSLAEAERQSLAFVERHCREGKSPLCGNSIWKDRQFLERYMPSLAGFLHYRVIDVSSIKELARRWYGERGEAPDKAGNHRALDDIRESIEELRWYRAQLFVDPKKLPAD